MEGLARKKRRMAKGRPGNVFHYPTACQATISVTGDVVVPMNRGGIRPREVEGLAQGHTANKWESGHEPRPLGPTWQGLVDFSGCALPSLYMFKVEQEPEKTSYPGSIQVSTGGGTPPPVSALGAPSEPTGVHQSELRTVDNGPPCSDLEKPLWLAHQLVSAPREGYQLPGNAWRS